MSSFRKLTQAAGMLMLVLACVLSAHAQSTTGNVRGIVTDQNGAVVPNAKVTLNQKSTNTATVAQTSDQGDFAFNNLLVGDYTITVEAPNFKSLTVNDVRVLVSQTTDVPAQLTVGGLGETVEVTAGGAELVETTTGNLSKSFSARQVVELAQTSLGISGVNNLSLLAPGVTSSGGVGVGSGGSVGGQRPRNNNFVLDGVDNNDKSVTGPQSYISPEEVAEFSLLQNQFSAEFGRSNGGQFITVTKSGSNDFHGSAYGFFRNRFLNAIDVANKQEVAGDGGQVRERNVPGTTFLPRSDYDRAGFNLSGRVIIPWFDDNGGKLIDLKDKLFFFTSYERLQQGNAGSPGGLTAPTAAGYATLASISGYSQTNLNVLRQFLAPASGASRTLDLCRVPRVNASGVYTGECPAGQSVAVQAGAASFPYPNFSKQNHAVINLDFTQSAQTQHRFRFTMTNNVAIDTADNSILPIFFGTVPNKQRLFSYTLLHNFTPNLINETRIAFRRSSNTFPVPNLTFPGLNAFPNLDFDDLGVVIGPDPNAPQGTIENNYQVVNNVTYLAGNHALKFGGDFRNVISPQSFIQRFRGDYEYVNLDDYLLDLSPEFGERNVSLQPTYFGNQHIFYGFIQDDWRVRPNLTLNLGLGYSYQGVPLSARQQTVNAISSVPGLLEFREPKAQKRNFAPKIGFAYSPNYSEGMLGRIFGANGKSSLRAGFSLGYDYIFDNLYILSNPPQAQQTVDVGPTLSQGRNFLANGGISPIPVLPTTAAAARAATGSFIPDQEVPYSITYTGSFQRQIGNDWSFEVRYLGTRGVHLLTQNRLNVLPKVDPDLGLSGLPTFLQQPSQALLNSLSLTLAQINARPRLDPRYSNAGFTSNVVAFLSNGNSTYHGASGQLTHRFARGFQGTAAYTWSHLIDDTTAEVFSTVLSPRRVEDFRNLQRERADSALDRRHRFVASTLYELPFFRKESNKLVSTLLGGFSLAGTYTYESGEKVTIRSGTDANLNGDNAGDRGILNPAGTEGVGSAVTALTRTDGQIVGYLAVNGNARYIQTGSGAVSNLARNTFQTPNISNFDLSVFKNFRMGETRAVQLRADFFNAFNHPQFVPGSVNTVDPIGTTGVTQYNQIAPVTPDFLKADRVFSSNPRVVQLALRFNF